MTDQAQSRLYPKRPVIGVGAVVRHGESVLLICRALPPRAGQWSIPGGRLEPGETPCEAVAREVLEETGVTVRDVGFLTTVDAITPDEAGGVRYHYLLVDYVASAISPELDHNHEVIEARWVLPGELDSYSLWPETRRVIALALATPDRAIAP